MDTVNTTPNKKKKNEAEVKITPVEISIEEKVEEKIEEFIPYYVKIVAPAVNYRRGPSTNCDIINCLSKGKCKKIINEKFDSNGCLWGELEDHIGWICLKYTVRV